MPDKEYMKIDEILSVIQNLSRSQGSYGRLYEGIMAGKASSPEHYEFWAKHLESLNFSEPLDVVLYFEEDKLPKDAPAQPPLPEDDPQHYGDGHVDVRVIPEFCMTVFVNNEGRSMTVGYDSNLFYASDLVAAYKEIYPDGRDEGYEEALRAFKDYLLRTNEGLTEEELG